MRTGLAVSFCGSSAPGLSLPSTSLEVPGRPETGIRRRFRLGDSEAADFDAFPESRVPFEFGSRRSPAVELRSPTRRNFERDREQRKSIAVRESRWLKSVASQTVKAGRKGGRTTAALGLGN